MNVSELTINDWVSLDGEPIMSAFPVYVGLDKFYAYPLDFACKPNHKVCRWCMCFGGYLDENHFLCREYWRNKVIKKS